MERLRQLIHEIHRRSLWQVLAIYAVASWAVLQVVDTLGGVLRLPDWTEPFALVLLIVGLPIVLATAFVQEGGPRRSAPREVEAADARAPTSRLFTWRNALGGGVLGFALWGVVAAAWMLYRGGADVEVNSSGARGAIDPSIAVLPFKDLSAEGNQQYFVEGLSEEIINALAQIRDLKVSARTSTFLLAERGTDIAALARTLGVANVLEGSVRKSGDRVRITAQLIEADTEFHLWSETFDRRLDDMFAVQDEIAHAITDALEITLSLPQGHALVPEATESSEAYEDYLRAQYLLSQRSEQSLRDAIQLFRDATDDDPEFAEAYAGLAQASFLLFGYAVDPDRAEIRASLDRATLAARTAASLAPELGLSHVALGMAAVFGGDFEESRREMALAVQLSPASAEAYASAATISLFSGHPEDALAAAEQAVSLDPVNPQSNLTLINALSSTGRVEEARAGARDLVRLAPGFANGWMQLARMQLDDQDFDGALDSWVRLGGLWGVEDAEAWRAAFERIVRYRKTGEPGALPDVSRVPYQYRPVLSTLLGRHEEAVQWLRDVLDQGAYVYVALFHQSMGSALAGDPAYQALLDESGITW